MSPSVVAALGVETNQECVQGVDSNLVTATPNVIPNRISVSAIVLAFGEEPWLEKCVEALLQSEGLGRLEIVVVDNGCMGDGVARVAGCSGLITIRPGTNLGFAGGCNYGALHATGDVLAFVNSDAIVHRSALRHLAEAALEPGVGIATGSIRLADAPDRLNSGGNEIHFLGLGWAGKFGELASAHNVRREVTGASGAGMAITRLLWSNLGGFESRYFAYHEDAELSLRCWQSGRSVLFVPEAVVVHYYEFSRNATKLYLLERNRLVFVLTLYEAQTILALAPALLLFELAMLAVALRGGWATQKVAGWAWLIRNHRWVWSRRQDLQLSRAVSDPELLHLFADRLRSGHSAIPGWVGPGDAIMSRYWTLVCRWLRHRGPRLGSWLPRNRTPNRATATSRSRTFRTGVTGLWRGRS